MENRKLKPCPTSARRSTSLPNSFQRISQLKHFIISVSVVSGTSPFGPFNQFLTDEGEQIHEVSNPDLLDPINYAALWFKKQMHSVLGLVGSIIWGVVVTHFICIRELFQYFIYRKQKCVKGKIVVVTGTGHGLGRRIARDFSRLGSTVVCMDMDKERNENTVWDIKNMNGKAVSVICDVTDRNQVYNSVDCIRREVGEIDIFVSCVGIYPVQEVMAWKPEELYELFDTNVMAQFWVLHAVIPHMIARKSGHFVAISSAAAIAPVGNEVPYSMTKASLTCLMDGFRQELKLQKHDGIKLTCVHPYYTACREDIPVKFDLRFPRQSPDFVSKEIVKGIRQECEIISVPRFMLFWIHFMKLLPYSARKRWRDIFYTRVFPTDNSANMYTPDGKVKNIVEQYKLPPLKQGKSKPEDVSIKIEDVLKGQQTTAPPPKPIPTPVIPVPPKLPDEPKTQTVPDAPTESSTSMRL